jgi:hypothetical protein
MGQLKQTYNSNTARSLRKRIQRFAVDARKFWLGNAILYLFRKYPVVANDVFTGSVPTASQFITLFIPYTFRPWYLHHIQC